MNVKVQNRSIKNYINPHSSIVYIDSFMSKNNQLNTDFKERESRKS